MGEDQKVINLVQEVFGVNVLDQDTSLILKNSNSKGGVSTFIPKPDKFNLAKALDSKLVPDVEFIPAPQLDSDFGKFSYIHKINHGRDIYFFANSSDETIETDVLLRGELSLDEWDPHTGIIVKKIKTRSVSQNDQQFTRFNLQLEPVRSTFYISR